MERLILEVNETFLDPNKTLCTDRGGEYYDPVFFQSVGIIHETTTPYTPQQNGMAERKNRALNNFMLSYSGLSEGFWGEAMLTACCLLNRVPNKRNKTTPYELWYKKRPNFSYLRVWGCRAVVRLPDPKRKTLGEKGIECIFVGYAEHSKALRFYVIKPNESVSINSIIESRDAIFDENRFSSIPRPKDIIPNSIARPKDIIPNLVESQRDDHFDDVPSEIPEPRKVERSRDQVRSQYSYCYSIEEDPRTYDEAMQSRDAAFWKEAIDDEIGSIMENNTWILSNLPSGCKPLGCKWIFKRKMKVDGTIDKFKARLVIQVFKQKEGIDYFDTYAPVARITTIRFLLALAAIHNLVIHQMDVKTAFLNGDLDEVYMKQLEGFVMPVKSMGVVAG
ncbi:zinc finger, CCHC-type containing protein [Tanacetum coccineum]|uniref:Zinc finger, CCHC-type containing protein n=1 Tax=Tanacetum coccineum TaxID=301880 RepID=A0ABQ4Z026_9ASTR